jgi:hypothetical protein
MASWITLARGAVAEAVDAVDAVDAGGEAVETGDFPVEGQLISLKLLAPR